MVSQPKMGNEPTFRDVAHRGPPVMDQLTTTEILELNWTNFVQDFDGGLIDVYKRRQLVAMRAC